MIGDYFWNFSWRNFKQSLVVWGLAPSCINHRPVLVAVPLTDGQTFAFNISKYWSPHTTNDCLKFLQEKFQNRVVSNRLEFFWPAKSPDLNPLDFFFWGIAEKSVYDAKPRSLEQLKKVVELCAKNVSRGTLLKAADNFRKRATLCLENEGSHFEHLLK